MTAQDNEISAAERLGFQTGQTVQEIGWDEDSDEVLRRAVAETTGKELVDEDFEDLADVVLLWWRDENGDLVDALVDALSQLEEEGHIWLLTPKSGREGYVAAEDISVAVTQAGLARTSNISATADWTGARLLSPKARRKR